MIVSVLVRFAACLLACLLACVFACVFVCLLLCVADGLCCLLHVFDSVFVA